MDVGFFVMGRMELTGELQKTVETKQGEFSNEKIIF